MSRGTLPQITDLETAEERLSGHVRLTPMLESRRLNAQLGARLLVKMECLQRTGSFKFRGAFNKIAQIPEDRRSRGVVTFSSGNHAQGVAAAAQIYGLSAIVVMPSDAPSIKIKNTKSYGSKVVFYERIDGNRVQVAEQILSETAGTLVPPYNDLEVIAGQGTIGLELIRQANATDANLDIVLGPASGGGMLSGVAIALANRSPKTLLYSVEPYNYDDIAKSLIAGKRVTIETGKPSVCDALLLETPGQLTFDIMKSHLSGGLLVSDEEVFVAMRVAFEEFKVVLEPSGAVALAAALSGKVNLESKTVGIICTGGNVEPNVFVKSLSF